MCFEWTFPEGAPYEVPSESLQTAFSNCIDECVLDMVVISIFSCPEEKIDLARGKNLSSLSIIVRRAEGGTT
jgi:hypothetical protein